MKVIHLKSITPLATRIVTTAALYEQDCTENGLIDTSKKQATYKEYQKVLAIGDSVRNIKVGDLVCIDPTRYLRKKYAEDSMKNGVVAENPIIYVDFPLVELNGEVCLMIHEQDVQFKVDDYEEVEENVTLE